MTVASAADLGSYSSYSNFGVNPIAQQFPVQHLGYNAGAIQKYASPYASHYASPYAAVQKVVAPHAYAAPHVYGAQAYGAQKVYAAPQVYAAPHVYGAQAYGAQKIYAGQDAVVDRDFNIEGLGERYSIQSGPASFQYSFLKGADIAAPHAVAQKFVAPAAYDNFGSNFGSNYGSHYGSYGSYAVPNVYGSSVYDGSLRSAPIVHKVDNFAAKHLIK